MGQDQNIVWNYYQTEGVSIFDMAVPRLAHLFRRARGVVTAPKPRVLNIGVGNGWLERRCHQEGWEAHGLDPNKAAIEELRAAGINGVQAGIEAMPYEDETFDVVFASEVLEHLTDDLLNPGIREIRRILKKGGVFLGTVPFQEPLDMRRVVCMNCGHVHHAYGHHQSFSAKRLGALFTDAGLRPINFRLRAFPGFQRRNFLGKLKSAVWVVAGRIGTQAADPKIVFSARR